VIHDNIRSRSGSLTALTNGASLRSGEARRVWQRSVKCTSKRRSTGCCRVGLTSAFHLLSIAHSLTRFCTAAELKILLSKRFMEAVVAKATAHEKGAEEGTESGAGAPTMPAEQPKGADQVQLAEAESTIARLRAEIAAERARREEAEAALADATSRFEFSEKASELRAAVQDRIIKFITKGI
jgi:hypothetical protein